jgi:hypothetical protein
MVASKRSEDGQERKWHSFVSGFVDERPANPFVEIIKGAANDSPSAGGEGRGEGGCHSFIHNPCHSFSFPGPHFCGMMQLNYGQTTRSA